MTSLMHDQNVTLVDAVDRLLGKGVTILGDVVISLAGVDLVYLSLRTLLGSVDTIGAPTQLPASEASERVNPAASDPAVTVADRAEEPGEKSIRRTSYQPGETATSAPRRIEADSEHADRGLAQLVLTLIELLRQLMERQALRRFDAGSLSARQQEEVGTALMKLAEKMEELKDHFRLEDEDLNIHLGPLGDLV